MAVTSALQKRTVKLQLNNGSIDGKVKTVSVDLFNMSEGSAYTDEIAVTLATALSQCLSKNLYAIQKTETSNLTQS